MPVIERFEIPCFRYNGLILSTCIDVEEGSLVRCRVRQALYVLTPEERVRQAMLWFLLEGAKSAVEWKEMLRFRAERSSLDIVGYYTGPAIHQRFSPNVPVVVIETKREERELGDDASTESQLRTYMLRERCRAGLIFNAREAAWFSLEGEFGLPSWTRTNLSDLCDAEARLSDAAAKVGAHLAECASAFAAAESGGFDSLLHLVTAFGSNTNLTFDLSIRSRESISAVQAFSLQTPNNEIVTFRARGVVSRSRQQLTRRDFHRLLAIRPL